MTLISFCIEQQANIERLTGIKRLTQLVENTFHHHLVTTWSNLYQPRGVGFYHQNMLTLKKFYTD